MKLVKRFLLVTAALSGIIFAGCNKSDTQDNVSLTVTPTAETVSPGALVVFTFNASSNVNLTDLSANETVNGQGSTPYDTSLKASNSSSLPGITWTIQVPASAHGGDVEVFTFTLTDKNGQTATATSTITIAGTATTYNSIILGDQGASQGSAFESSTGTVLNYSSDSTNSANIDFVCVTNSSLNLLLVAPSDANAILLNSREANWPVKNATQFKTGVQGSFANFTNSVKVDSAYTSATGTASTNVNIDAGNNLLVAFLTASGKHGVIEITNANPAASASGGGTATINVVVSQ